MSEHLASELSSSDDILPDPLYRTLETALIEQLWKPLVDTLRSLAYI
jgi:hypothetical protein